MKVQLTLDDELVKRVDSYADNNYMSRSGLVSFALSQFLNGAEATKAIKDMALCMRKIADTGTVDHEIIEQLEDFERFTKVFLGGE